MADARSAHTATRLFGGKVLVAGGSGAAGTLASAELLDPESGRWTRTGSLGNARSGHSATLIWGLGRPTQCGTNGSNCGKVVVAGGTGGDGKPLASAELFDPATATWTRTGSLGDARTSQTSTLLSNGKVLVTGGTGANGRPLASAELLTPATGTWTRTGSLSDARSRHSATLLSDGRVVVAGGVGADGKPLASAELFDPATGTWTRTGALGDARSAHTATALGDATSGGSESRVLAAGGTGGDGKPLASAELFNPTTGTWTRTGGLSEARSSHTAALVSDGKVLAAGGTGAAGKLASTESFDPATGSWTKTGALGAAASSQAAAVLLDGRMLATGGSRVDGGPLTASELYEPVLGNRWAPTASLRDPRSGHTATLLPDGNVLVAGGHRTMHFTFDFSLSPLATAEVYHPRTGTWTQTGALARARSLHTATLLTGSPAQCGQNCGKVLVTGGVGADSTGQAETLATAELYDPATGSWSSTAPMTTPRYADTATLLRDGRVLVAAGFNGITDVNTAEIYDPARETWTPTGNLRAPPPMPATDGTPVGSKDSQTATLLDKEPCGRNCGKVLVTGGEDGVGTGPSLDTVELYDPTTGTFTQTESLGQSRQVHNAILLDNGKVLVTGGFHSPFTSAPPHLAAAELYNPVTESWESAGSSASRRVQHTTTLLPSGRLLAAGGAAGGNAPGFPDKAGPGLPSAELYDPAGNQWNGTDFLNTPRVLHTATLLAGSPAQCADNCGKVLVAGGDRELIANFLPSADYISPLGSAELYTPASQAGPATGGELPLAGATGMVDKTTPGVSGYGITNNPFVVGGRTPTFGAAARRKRHRRGTTFKYTLSEAATVRIVIARGRTGRRRGKRCVAPTRRLRKAKKCIRLTVTGTLTRTSHRGANRVGFSGRVGNRALSPGHYEARLTATDAAKNASKPKTIVFTIVKR